MENNKFKLLEQIQIYTRKDSKVKILYDYELREVLGKNVIYMAYIQTIQPHKTCMIE